MNYLGWFWRSVFAAWLCGATAYGIGIRITETSGGTLEDAILIASVGGAVPRDAVELGDLDLSAMGFVFDVAVADEATHWWLIGHQGGNVVYSSTLDLAGVDLYSVEPYDMEGAEFAWNIPGNLHGYVTGGEFSSDWWAQTVNNHSSHVAPDEGEATLWLFSSPGSAFGTIAVNLHSNEVPGVPSNGDNGEVPVPDAGSAWLLLLCGAAGLSLLRRK